MVNATIEDVNRNILILRKKLEVIEEILEEDDLELREEVIATIEESRKRPVSEFKSQIEIEKKFLWNTRWGTTQKLKTN